MHMATTNTTPAQTLRAALKAAGFNARRVTVRQNHSTLYVTIRDAWASLTKVKAIADQFRVVQHCHATGEILGGGNTFVDVRYTDELVKPVQAAILVVLDPAPHDQWVTVLGEFRATKVSRQCGATYPDEVRMQGPGFDSRNAMACGVGWAAKRIAIAFLDASASTNGTASASEARS
jgi:hypothetical protein